MAFISRLQGQMCVLGLLLVVCFMSLTADAQGTTVTALLIKPNATTTAHITPSKTSTTTTRTISPTRSTPSTAASTTTQTTKAPNKQPTAAPAESGRKFDGASFVGGIILGIVITGILILGFKWWQSRNKSYHSL